MSRFNAAHVSAVLVLSLAAPVQAAQSRTAYVVTEVTNANAGLGAPIRTEKYGLMKASAFAFFRGSNHLYWKDFGNSANLYSYGAVSTTRIWLNGDMHVDNMGSFDDDQGDIVFGLNDFDEALIGDYQLDVWRMAVSLVLIARANGFGTTNQNAFVDSFTENYLDTMASYAGNPGETTKKFKASNTYGLLDDFLTDVASSNSRTKMLNDWTVKVGGVRQLNTSSNPNLAAVTGSVDTDIRNHMSAYRATLSGGSIPSSYFTVKSVAQRLHAGVGSLGAQRYYVLIEGASSGQDDDGILDMKAQATPSAYAYVPSTDVTLTNNASGSNMAARTAVAYKALGYRVDDYLGWVTLSDGLSYSVRERSPYKDSFDTTTLNSVTRFTNLAEQWGQVLATHHARADKDADPNVISYSVDSEIDAITDGDHAGFRALVRSLASDYATQVQYDYASFYANF